MAELGVRPIGRVSSERTEPLDDGCDSVGASITLDAEQFGPEALQGLEAFSHVEVVYVFDRVDPGRVQTAARRPRGNPDWPQVGSSRSGPRAGPTGSASRCAGC